MRFLFLRFLRLLARIARAIGATEVRFLFPKEFLERVLREMPQSLHVEVTGPSEIVVFSYYASQGDGVLIMTSFYKEDGLMPYIYRALLSVGAENNGFIRDPFKALSDNHWALTEFLGASRVDAIIMRRKTTQPDKHAEA